jgi:hypothetical protein
MENSAVNTIRNQYWNHKYRAYFFRRFQTPKNAKSALININMKGLYKPVNGEFPS